MQKREEPHRRDGAGEEKHILFSFRVSLYGAVYPQAVVFGCGVFVPEGKLVCVSSGDRADPVPVGGKYPPGFMKPFFVKPHKENKPCYVKCFHLNNPGSEVSFCRRLREARAGPDSQAYLPAVKGCQARRAYAEFPAHSPAERGVVSDGFTCLSRIEAAALDRRRRSI